MILAGAAGLAAALMGFAAPTVAPARVEAKLDRSVVGMGRTVVVRATARLGNGQPAAGCEMLPYVNGKRWGPHELADAGGRALFRIPLPTPGRAAIRVQARARPGDPDDFWIWSDRQNVPETIFFQRTFRLTEAATRGVLWLAVDDGAVVYLNGARVGEKAGWSGIAPIALDPALFRVGQNVVSVDATNGGGACGLLLRLSADTATGRTEIMTDSSWRVFAARPPGWPAAPGEGGAAATPYGRADAGATMPSPWPSIAGALRIVGMPLPADAVASPPAAVTVVRRALQRPPTDANRLIAMQWEQWFTPLNAFWQTAQAVPLIGFYDARIPEVARQHLIWFIESGVDCIIADWSNNIWFSRDWAPGGGIMELIDATRVMMDQMAQLRGEGVAVPKMTLLTGVGHLRPEGPVVANKQLTYIFDTLVREPRYRGLWQEFDGKPLILALDLSASYLKEGFKLDDRFTVRYMGASQDVTRTHELGLWSWMDHLTPAPTVRGGRAEGMTVSVGSFGAAGWLARDARGRRNGATLVEDWQAALEHRPRFLQVHQFQEFAGQLEGKPAAAPDRYYDSYSAELSDDIEPTSRTAPAYRGEGGWGFFYLNLLRALVDLYRQPAAETTVLVVARPLDRQGVRGDTLNVEWRRVGRAPRSYRVLVDGKSARARVKGDSAAVDLRALRPGMHTLRIVAEGAVARYRLSWTEDSLPLARPEPAMVEVSFCRLAAGQESAVARTEVRPMTRVRVRQTLGGAFGRKIVELLARHLRLRFGATVATADRGDVTVELAVHAGVGSEGYAITDGPGGAVRIVGNDARGLLYGVGRFLRSSRLEQGAFVPCRWRGSSAPAMPVRGIYFATHFHNFYHDAPVDEVRSYVEDLALWGVNTLIVWYDMHHFMGWDDPAAAAFRVRLRSIMECAKGVGIGVGLVTIANEGYGNSPAELRGDAGGMRGAVMVTDICTSKPEGQRYVLANFARLFDWVKDLHPDFVWLWPYDSGGCGCAACRPWGSKGFLRAAEKLAVLARQKLGSAQIALSTWFLDPGEWAGLASALPTKPAWADYLICQPGTPAFTGAAPGGLPILGFPEISMEGMWPWGGFGANPQPVALQRYWDAVKAKSRGGFPYSEGIFEDMNKVILAQLYWSPDRPVDDILKEYAAWEFSPEVAAETLEVIATLERNHHMRWWPGLLEGYTGWFPSRGATPQADPGAEGAYAAVRVIDARLPAWGRCGWRWRIVYLRALLDAELKGNGGRPNEACEQAFEELTRIFHAGGAQVDLKPPATPGRSAAPG